MLLEMRPNYPEKRNLTSTMRGEVKVLYGFRRSVELASGYLGEHPRWFFLVVVPDPT